MVGSVRGDQARGVSRSGPTRSDFPGGGLAGEAADGTGLPPLPGRRIGSPTILMLHGGQNQFSGREHRSGALADRGFTTWVALDTRGHGGSDARTGRRVHSIHATIARDVTAVLGRIQTTGGDHQINMRPG